MCFLGIVDHKSPFYYLQRAVIFTLFYSVEQKNRYFKEYMGSSLSRELYAVSLLWRYGNAPRSDRCLKHVWNTPDSRQQFVNVSSCQFRECVLPAFIMASDAHKLCVMREERVLEGAEFTHCDESGWGNSAFAWLFFLRNESQASLPHGLDPVSAEAQWQLRSWGSQTNWRTSFTRKLHFSSFSRKLHCSYIREACLAATFDLTESILCVSASSSEEFRCRGGCFQYTTSSPTLHISLWVFISPRFPHCVVKIVEDCVSLRLRVASEQSFLRAACELSLPALFEDASLTNVKSMSALGSWGNWMHSLWWVMRLFLWMISQFAASRGSDLAFAIATRQFRLCNCSGRS